jgi:hypothetical protein
MEFDPENLLTTAIAHGVEFKVIGAVAAWLQGNPSITHGLDLMPRMDADNAERLAAALNALSVRPPGADTPIELEGADFLGWKSQSFDTDAGPIDIVPKAAAVGGYEDVATVELRLGDISVRAITLDDVIASKEKLGRPKDTAALPALYATREALRRKKI